MRGLAFLVRAISRFNDVFGSIFAWMTLAVVLICFAVVVLRYGFYYGEVWMQDLYVWLNGAIFTAVAGQVLLRDGHVRVDVFYRPAGPRYKAWVDLAGTVLFLIPYLVVLWMWSWDYITASWVVREASRNSDGLQGLYVLKTFLLIFIVTVGLQGIAMMGRSILVLAGRSDLVPDKMRYEGL